MSVFQRGGSFLQRSLSKLYSDTKQSYETATVTSRAEDDPDVVSLQREYRIQKDRLLAWGLDWSDSDTTEFPDVQIDDSVDQAGFGDVVAYIMSTIQDLLVESEKLQSSLRPTISHPSDQKPPGSFPAAGNEDPSTLSSSWSPDQLQKSRGLLAELTACIDYLFRLSASRRARRKSSKDSLVSKDSFIKNLEQVRNAPSFQSGVSERVEVASPTSISAPATTLQHPGFSALLDREVIPIAPTSQPPQPNSQPATDPMALICARFLGVDADLLTISNSPESDEASPPTYDAAVGADITRKLVTVDVKNLGAVLARGYGVTEHRYLRILAETTPIRSSSPGMTASQQLRHDTHHSIEGSVKRGINTWNGIQIGALPRLIGHTADETSGQHVTMYKMPQPSDEETLDGRQPSIQILNSLFTSGDSTDHHMPSLEDRFRIGFNLVFSLMQSHRSHSYHGNVNSSNIVLLKSATNTTDYIRSPYLVSQMDFAPYHTLNDADTPFSTKIYRHPREKESSPANDRWAFDSYSLGLVLLEVGLWTPLRRLWKPKYDANTFRSRIRTVYTPKLASRCGSAYMKAVQACIDAPESDASPFTYMADILNIFSRCCAIDLDGPSTSPIVTMVREWVKSELELESRPQDQPHKLTPSAAPSQEVVNDDFGPMQAAEEEVQQIDAPISKRTFLKKWDAVDIPQGDLDLWNNLLMPRLSKLLQNMLGNSSESCSASLMMIGPSPDAARTTICIQCTSVDLVRKALKKQFKCKKTWGLVVLRGDVQRCNRGKRDSTKMKAPASPSMQDDVEADSFYQQRPCGGASIGAYRDFEHLPPVSFGGAVMVAGQLYGMTVHHMLDSPEDDEEESAQPQAIQRSAAVTQSMQEDLSFMGGGPDQPYDPSLLEISDDEAFDLDEADDEQDDFWFSSEAELTTDDSDVDSDDDDASSVGDVPGISPFSSVDDDLVVTQPALDDVEEDFFPSPEDRDDDHLSSHTLGYVHASSGIRRVVKNGVKHEIDWALIRIEEDRLPEANIFPTLHLGGQKMLDRDCQQTITLTKIASQASLLRTPVMCQGRSSGLQSGTISPALSLVKFPGRATFSSSYCVSSNSNDQSGRNSQSSPLGVPGDSGAWVFNPVDKSLCGHVLAWGRRLNVAFISPMEVMVQDMERVLGGEVMLPDASAEATPIHSSPLTIIGSKARTETNASVESSEVEDVNDTDDEEAASELTEEEEVVSESESESESTTTLSTNQASGSPVDDKKTTMLPHQGPRPFVFPSPSSTSATRTKDVDISKPRNFSSSRQRQGHEHTAACGLPLVMQ